MIQVVKPNTNVKVLAGQCHKLARTVFGAPPREPSAWKGWKNAIGRHIYTSHPKNVSVPVWFSHWGTYGNPPRYKNWGHVVVYVPGRGYLSSPGSGYGNKWFKTIPEIERYFNCRLAGWSEGINGVRVVAKRPKPTPEPKPIPMGKKKENDMLIIRCVDALGPGKRAWAIFGPGYWDVTDVKKEVVNYKAQWGMGDDFDVLTVTKSTWDEKRSIAMAVMTPEGIKATLAREAALAARK